MRTAERFGVHCRRYDGRFVANNGHRTDGNAILWWVSRQLAAFYAAGTAPVCGLASVRCRT